MNKISSLFRAPALSCVSLVFTLHFSLFTFNSNAQGLTKYGEITTIGANYIGKNGGIGGSLGSDKYGKQVTAIVIASVTSTTGKIWMDRNLGATQVATSSTDYLAYGSLYQWGRGSDGHQLINWTNASTGTPVNGTTTSLSSTDTPGDGKFITISEIPYDWRNGQNTNLWQGVNGINNPCPSGYRIPTSAELEAEKATFTSPYDAGAFASPLKLPVAGYRSDSDGSLSLVGTGGRYWSSTYNVEYNDSFFLFFSITEAGTFDIGRASGLSIRCIKNKLAVGENYQGGKIAYLLVSGDTGYDANVQHGLIAATEDQSTETKWGQRIEVGTSDLIGSGFSNTNAIISKQVSLALTEYAAGLARSYRGGGYADWYLPSIKELRKLLDNQNLIMGFSLGSSYWSSTENANQPAEGAQSYLFSSDPRNKIELSSSKVDGLLRVRAVRSF
jgi:hypothetical protein